MENKVEDKNKLVYMVYDYADDFFGLIETDLNKTYFEYWLYYWMKICRCITIKLKFGDEMLMQSENVFMNNISNDLKKQIEDEIWKIEGFINFIKRKTTYAISLKEPIHVTFSNEPKGDE